MIAKPRLSEHLKDDKKSNYRSSKTTAGLCPLYILYCGQHNTDIIILTIIYATSFSGVGGKKEKNPRQKN